MKLFSVSLYPIGTNHQNNHMLLLMAGPRILNVTKEDVEEANLHTRHLFSGTLISRLSGYGRDFAMALTFGDHPSVASFMIAFRFANLLRRLVADGPFRASFIPCFEEQYLRSPEQATLFFQKLTAFLVLVLLIVVMALELGTYTLFSSLSLSIEHREIVQLSQILFPAILFICLYGMNASLLQCKGHFFLSSIAPVFCNIIWIGAVFLLQNRPPSFAMYILAGCVVLGFCAQWCLTLPTTLRYTSASFREWLPLRIPPEVKRMLSSFSLAAVGIGAVQINAFIDALFAKTTHSSGPVYLWYAIRIEQLALAIFGIACVTAITPKLSRYIKADHFEHARFLFSLSFQRIVSILTPCTFALILLGGGAINVIYGRGQFSAEAVRQTTLCLWAYALGLLPNAMIILYSSLFYAQDNFRFPTRISLISIFANIVLNVVFVFVLHLGVASVAFSTSLSAWFQFFSFQKKATVMGWRTRFRIGRVVHIVSASAVASLCALLSYHFFFSYDLLALIEMPTQLFSRSVVHQAITFFVPSFAFLLGIFAYTLGTQNKDLIDGLRSFVAR